MPRQGYIKLHRKLLDNGIFKNPNLVQFWVYCLLKASHKEHTVMVGYQEVVLRPGEFLFGRKATAQELGQSEKVVRTSALIAAKIGLIRATQRASKYTVYSVVNWSTYQDVEQEQGQQVGHEQGQERASKGPQTRMIKNGEKYSPGKSAGLELSVEELRGRYPDQALLDKVIDAIASTRKSGKVSPSIVQAQFRAWERFPVEQVQEGVGIYLERDYASQGKGEKYLLGVIRGCGKREAAAGSPAGDSDWWRGSTTI
ncbi:MAG: hypothetical protein AB1568_16280 [Thermodesulfobacteriota bacterium]